MTERDESFDLAAAALRAGDPDVAALFEVLAAKLAEALPDRCVVDRRRTKPFPGKARATRVTVDLGGRRFVLRRDGHDVVGEVETAVHDMRRRTEQVGVDAWVAALREELERQAEESAEARAALERLLGA